MLSELPRVRSSISLHNENDDHPCHHHHHKHRSEQEKLCSLGQSDHASATRSVGSRSASLFTRVWKDRKTRRLTIFLLLNIGMMFVEVVIGYITNSLGLLSDAGHMAFDCLALIVALVAAHLTSVGVNMARKVQLKRRENEEEEARRLVETENGCHDRSRSLSLNSDVSTLSSNSNACHSHPHTSCQSHDDHKCHHHRHHHHHEEEENHFHHDETGHNDEIAYWSIFGSKSFFSYGFARLEILGGFVNALSLLLLSIG